jgi:PAS domain S-box-containing protein
VGLEALVQQLHDAVAFVDPAGRVLLTNRKRELPGGPAVGSSLDLSSEVGVFHPGGRPYKRGEWPLARTLRSGEVIADEEFYVVGADGSRQSFSCRCAPFYDDRRRLVGAVSVARDVTERNHWREQLAYLLPLLDQTEDAIIAFDPEWRATAWNKGAERMYGWSAEEALGRELRSFMRVDLSDEQHAEFRRQIAECGRWRGEVAVGRKDGSVLSVESINVAIRDQHSQITGYLAIHRDVTERKRVEAALREAQRRSETILESITDSFSALDADWRYTYLNERALARIQAGERKAITLGDLVGRNVWEAFPHMVDTIIDHELHRAVREQHTVAFETYSSRTDEWLEVHAYPSRDGGVSVYGHDITERKRAEEQIAYNASLVENMQDAVVGTDERFIVTAWNPGAKRLYAWRADEVLGRHVSDVVRSELSDEDRAARFRLIAEEGRSGIEVVAYRKDGTPVHVETVNVALRDERGEITGYLGIHRDITHRKRAEEELRKATARTKNILESITDSFSALDADWRFTYLNQRTLDRIRKAKGEDVPLEDVLGKICWEVTPALVGTEIEHEFHWAVREQQTVVFETYSPDTDEWLEVHAYPSEQGGLSVYTRDITERKRAEEELERRVRQQAAVAELGLKALEDGRLQPLMDEAVRLVCRTLGVEYAKVDELLPGGEGLLVRAGSGWGEGVVGGCVIPAGRGSPAGYALLVGEPVIVDDMTAETRFEVPAVLGQYDVMSDITVVIDPHSNPFGTLAAASTKRLTFSEDDVSFVQSVANVLATAVERAKSDERLDAAREAERSRIARDLHDQALGGLTDALLDAQAVRAAASDAGTAKRVDRLVPTLIRISQQLRAAIYDLRLPTEQHNAFPELLESLIALHRTMAAGTEIELEVRGDAVGSMGPRGTELLRIIGEALTNARRHSGAKTITVCLSGSSDKLVLEVADDGRGFDPAGATTTGNAMGTQGMRERAAIVGAELAIESERGAGTLVRVELPLVPQAIRGEPVRVLLVEDHTAVRQAIATAFQQEEDFEVVGEAGSLAEARQLLEHVDVAVVDLALPDGYGADLIAELRERNPEAQALVLTASLDRAEVARAVQSGAAAVLNKTAKLDEVVDDVRRLRAGETLPLDEVAELLDFARREGNQEHRDRQALATLTPREREVLQALADGLATQQIAERLQITIRTEQNHIASIMAKLGVHSRLQALVFALRRGIVEIR